MTQKTAIVTGAARGIGLATTRLFLEDGWEVAMIDRDGPALAAALEGLDGVLPVHCDVSRPEQVDAMVAMAVHTPEIIAAYHDAIPLARYGTERGIAEVVAFLCSDRASYVTGQLIAADGGFEATGIGLPALRGA